MKHGPTNSVIFRECVQARFSGEHSIAVCKLPLNDVCLVVSSALACEALGIRRHGLGENKIQLELEIRLG
jgi:hypothetical protein